MKLLNYFISRFLIRACFTYAFHSHAPLISSCLSFFAFHPDNLFKAKILAQLHVNK
uniref:Uncharacterized protein n=1 Tax=Meloidogyne enterolobii TaxID=390850 RepID=A0A6V7ULK1_MELEN|nr:unnamed protein product [Meloidogyne enterolobii]